MTRASAFRAPFISEDCNQAGVPLVVVQCLQVVRAFSVLTLTRCDPLNTVRLPSPGDLDLRLEKIKLSVCLAAYPPGRFVS